MLIRSATAFPVRLPADHFACDSPYSGALIRVTAENGTHGWGECQTPAPEAVCALIQHLIRHQIEEQEFDAQPESIARIWHRAHEDLRAEGQTGGLLLDALAALDMALWDLAGKLTGQPVAQMLGGGDAPRTRVPALWCGPEDSGALHQAWDAGFRAFKLHLSGTEQDLLVRLDTLRRNLPEGEGEIAVDARWRLDWTSAPPFGARLDERGVLWLECPFDPENPAWHGLLAARMATRIAIGQSYHTVRQLAPFFDAGGMRVVQPDAGRAGLSEGMRMARMAASYCMWVAPRAGLSVGPRLAASVHLAAAAPECQVLAYRPDAVALAARFQGQPVEVIEGHYAVPRGPGLGVEMRAGVGAPFLATDEHE
jgi:D-galactarolactone cycloisomerase